MWFIHFKTGTEDEIKVINNQELKDFIWERVLQVKEHPNFLQNPFVQAIAQKDATTRYRSCLTTVKQQAFKRNLKKIASFLFMHI